MAKFFKTIHRSVKHWYIPAVIGVLLIILGIYISTVPLSTYLVLTTLFSISFLASGILEIFFSVQNKESLDGWGWYLTGGILSTLIGIILIIRPEVSAAMLPFYIGFSLMFRSFQGLGLAFDLKEYGIVSWGNLALLSVLGIVFSLLLITYPLFTGLSLVFLTAFSFISVGIAAVILSFNLKKLKNLPSKMSNEFKEKIEDIKKEYKEILRNDK